MSETMLGEPLQNKKNFAGYEDIEVPDQISRFGNNVHSATSF